CTTLKRLAEHLPVHGSDADARSAATGLKRYFSTAAIQHHADEEQDLFPALIESMAGSDAVCIRGLTTALADEHRTLERLWRRLEAVLDKIELGAAATLPVDTVADFIGLYQRHIQREEDELLPMASRLLGDHDIDRIGRAMR